MTAQLVSHWPLSMEARIQSQSSVYWICGEQGGKQPFFGVFQFSLVSVIPLVTTLIFLTPTINDN